MVISVMGWVKIMWGRGQNYVGEGSKLRGGRGQNYVGEGSKLRGEGSELCLGGKEECNTG